MDCVLGVFAKEPRPGHVKTRLAAAIGFERAAALYEAFLRDFVPRLESLPVHRVLVYTPASGQHFFCQLADDRFELEEQQGTGLGARMAAFFETRFARGARRVVLIGSDTPDLPLASLERAFAELNRREIVLGPCTDGGYYLVGMNRWIPELFAGVNWSTGAVLAQTIRQINTIVARLTLLEPWYDVDRVEDVRHLSAEIGAASRRGRVLGLTHTEAVLRSLVELL